MSPWPHLLPAVGALQMQQPGGRTARRLATMSFILEAHRSAGSPGSRSYGGSPAQEEAQLASVLADRQRHSLLLFYSAQCRLCAALQPVVAELEAEHAGRLGVARLNTDHEAQWAPEMIHYEVQAVPCFVLLAPDGSALCKTTAPRSLEHMRACLGYIVGEV
eukprot:jgi/Tetstr1/423984/TSEL_014595.t1